MPKIVHFGELLENLKLRSNSVTRQVTMNKTQIGGKCQIEKFKCDILSNFQALWGGWNFTDFVKIYFLDKN